MDRLIYTAMTGARQAFVQQAGVAHNLSNASTIGYRAMEHHEIALCRALGQRLATIALKLENGRG